MKIYNTVDKLNYIFNKGFDVQIGKYEQGLYLDIISDYKVIAQEKDIDLQNVVDKTYKVMRAGGYK